MKTFSSATFRKHSRPMVNSRKTHGELLEQLRQHYKLSQQEFVEKVGKSRTWYAEQTVKDRLMPKMLTIICNVFQIPMEYWEGKYELPPLVQLTVSKEDVNKMGINNAIYQENVALKTQVQEMQAKYITVLEKYQQLIEKQAKEQ